MEATIPRSGAGVYSKPAGTTAISGTTIDSSDYNQTIDDLVNDANLARPIVAGGTGATSAAAARTSLGVQAADASLTSLAALATAADRFPYTTGVDTYAEAEITAFARGLMAAVNEPDFRNMINAAQTPLDQDDMAANSDVRPPTQQSTKAYVDNKVAALPFTKQFKSGVQSITSGGTRTLAHGLSEVPKLVQLRLRFTTSVYGYSTNDEIIIEDHRNADDGVDKGVMVKLTTSQIILYYGLDANVFKILDTNGERKNLSNADAQVIVYAWA